MPEFSDECLQEIDEKRLQADIDACNAHLADMVREHGAPPRRAQPVSYGRFGPSLPGTSFPQRTMLATLHGRW